MTYKIDKDVPVPEKEGRGRPEIYPFSKLGIGDSFLCEDKNVQYAASHYARRHGKKFATRTVDGGVRVWRLA